MSDLPSSVNYSSTAVERAHKYTGYAKICGASAFAFLYATIPDMVSPETFSLTRTFMTLGTGTAIALLAANCLALGDAILQEDAQDRRAFERELASAPSDSIDKIVTGGKHT